MRTDCYLPVVIAVLLLGGCDRSSSLAPDKKPELSSQTTSSLPPPPPPAETAENATVEQNSATEKPPQEQKIEQEVAKAGSGKKGRGYGGGIVTEPIRQYFITGDRLVFSVQIPQAMNLYKAQDSRGKGPQTHEEFMEKIIQANGIKLPPLPEGHNYFYDTKTEKLMDQYRKE